MSISLTLNTTNLSITWSVVFFFLTYTTYELYESPLVLNPKGMKQKEEHLIPFAPLPVTRVETSALNRES